MTSFSPLQRGAMLEAMDTERDKVLRAVFNATSLQSLPPFLLEYFLENHTDWNQTHPKCVMILLCKKKKPATYISQDYFVFKKSATKNYYYGLPLPEQHETSPHLHNTSNYEKAIYKTFRIEQGHDLNF